MENKANRSQTDLFGRFREHFGRPGISMRAKMRARAIEEHPTGASKKRPRGTQKTFKSAQDALRELKKRSNEPLKPPRTNRNPAAGPQRLVFNTAFVGRFFKSLQKSFFSVCLIN